MSARSSFWADLKASFSGWVGLVVAAVVGIVLGVGIYTLVYAGFTDYLGNNPQTCASCHAMSEQYAGYMKSSHKDVATCNDCHAPHDNLVSKYANKAENGFMHSLKFTFQNYPENIKIRDHNKRVTEAACLYCHENFVSQIEYGAHQRGETISCIRCHNEVGHLR